MNPKLAPLVRMLSAPHDGEVLATVAAIRRTLAADKQDLHDLARLIERELPAPSPAISVRGFNEYAAGYTAGQAARPHYRWPDGIYRPQRPPRRARKPRQRKAAPVAPVAPAPWKSTPVTFMNKLGNRIVLCAIGGASVGVLALMAAR